MSGVSKTHLNYIEKNEKEPSLAVAIQIASALNVKLEEIYRIVP